MTPYEEQINKIISDAYGDKKKLAVKIKALFEEQHTQLVREFVEDLNNAVHMAGVLRWGVEHHIDEVITKWSSLLPNNKEAE